MCSAHSKGQLEAEIAKAMIQFQREHLGRGPQEIHVWIIRDLILVRFQGVLTPVEKNLAWDQEGRHLVKEVRWHLIEGSRPLLEEMILQLTGVPMVSLHSDMSTKTGERIIVFTLAENLEEQLKH